MDEVYSYDRREEDMAVLVDDAGVSYPVPLTDLPADARPGHLLRKTTGGYMVDMTATVTRRQRVLELQRRLRKNQ